MLTVKLSLMVLANKFRKCLVLCSRNIIFEVHNYFPFYTFGFSRSWWGNVSKDERIEIDVVAESTDGKALLIGECKWTESKNGARRIFELEVKAKKLLFIAGKEIILCHFLKNSPVDIISQKVFLPSDIVMLLK